MDSTRRLAFKKTDATAAGQEGRTQTGGNGRNQAAFADQIVSSASNAILPFAVAALATSSEFAVFALAYGAFAVVLGALRTAYSETSLYSNDVDRSGISRTYLGATVAASAVIVLVALIIRPDGWPTIVVLGISILWVLPQDHLRYRLLATGQATEALRSDGVWLVVSLCGTAIGIFLVQTFPDLGLTGGTACALAWGLGGLLGYFSAADSLRRLGARRDDGGTSAGSGEISSAGRRMLLAESLAITGGSQLVLYAAGIAAGLDAVAILGAGVLVFQPWLSAVYGARILLLPRLRNPDIRAKSLSQAVALVLGGTLAWAAAAYVALKYLGFNKLLGDSWDLLAPVFLAVVVYEVSNALTQILADAFRVDQKFRLIVTTRVITIAVLLAGVLIGGAGSDAGGAAWGRGIAMAAGTAVWAVLVLRSETMGRQTRGALQ